MPRLTPKITARQKDRRRRLRESARAVEPEVVDPAIAFLDSLFQSGRLGYREALAAYAKGYGVATMKRLVTEAATSGIRGILGTADFRTQAERTSVPKVAPKSASVASTPRRSTDDLPRFPGRLVAVFCEEHARCALCGRGIKSKGGIELRNAGDWHPVCRDCKGRVVMPRRGAALAA